MTGICSSRPNNMGKNCSLGPKEIQFRRSRWPSDVLACKKFPEEYYSARHSGGGSLMIGGGMFHLQENINYNLSVVDKNQQIM